MSKIRFNYIFWSIVIIGITIRLVILFSPFDTFFERWGSDDLFYYSQIAGNFTESGRFSFDGVGLTNGFQPLFMFLLIPFGKLLQNDVQASIYIVLGITILLTFLTAIQIPKLFKAYNLDDRLALICTGLFLLHPKIISVTFNGTEMALSFLMVILALRALKWIQSGEKLLVSSLIFGGLVLTRMDFSILIFLFFLGGMIQKNTFSNWFKVLILPVLLFCGWLTFNYFYFDSILPSSGTAKKLHAEGLEINYIKQWLSTYSTAIMSESRISITLIILCILGGVHVLIKNKHSLRKYLVYLFALSAILGMIPIVSFGSFRDWYLIVHFLLILFLSAIGMQLLIEKTKSSILISLIIIAGLWTEAQFSQRDFNGKVTIEASNVFRLKIPQDASIGSFNAGIINCFIDDHRVVNIDGVVNNGILKNYKNKNLDVYLKENDIQYIIDNPSSIEFFLKHFSQNQKWEVLDQYQREKHEFVLVQLK